MHARAKGWRDVGGGFVRGGDDGAHCGVEFLARIGVDPGLIRVGRSGAGVDVAPDLCVDPEAGQQRPEQYFVRLRIGGGEKIRNVMVTRGESGVCANARAVMPYCLKSVNVQKWDQGWARPKADRSGYHLVIVLDWLCYRLTLSRAHRGGGSAIELLNTTFATAFPHPKVNAYASTPGSRKRISNVWSVIASF